MSKPPIALAYDRAEPHSSWPCPDMAIVNAGRATPPAFPGKLFGALWPIAVDLAEGAGSPVDYVGLSMLAVAASLIGGKRRVRPFEAGTWEEPCILWCANVGEPSSNKSPGTDAAISPLRPMEQAYAEDHKLVVQQFQTQRERAKHERRAWEEQVKEATKLGRDTPLMPDVAMEPECPERRRLLVQDSTPEALGSILAANPEGTLHLRDELAGWFQSFERYNAGGREFWLEAYGGRPHTIDRKNSEIPVRIQFNGVSVVGGIQPDKLVDLFQSGPDDGLTARFLWAWPDPIPFRRPRSSPDVGALQQAYARLEGLKFGCDENGAQVPKRLRLNDGAADIFEAWARENSAAMDDAASLFKSFLGKARGTVLRLALVSEAVSKGVERLRFL